MNKKNSLCWYCNRTVDGQQFCPWVDDGIAVDGWEIDDYHKISKSNISVGTPDTCNVVTCPLFIERTKSITFGEYINEVAATIGANYTWSHSHPEKLFQKYESTGSRIPQWVKNELENKCGKSLTK